MIFIQHVLIISNQTIQIYELVECLRENEILATVFPFNVVENKSKAFIDSDFIILGLEFDAQTNQRVLDYVKRNSKCPVFVLIEKQEKDEIRNYLDVNADGYFTITDDCRMVASKIKAVIRYVKSQLIQTKNIFTIDDLTINLTNRTISNEQIKHRLTIVEYMILKKLIENMNQTVSKDLLIQDVWDKNQSATDNALGIHISRLRKKTITRTEKQIIETVWGVGYRLNALNE